MEVHAHFAQTKQLYLQHNVQNANQIALLAQIRMFATLVVQVIMSYKAIALAVLLQEYIQAQIAHNASINVLAVQSIIHAPLVILDII